MNLDNTKIQMRKGVLEFCILSIIAQREVYTSEILQELKDAQLIVVEGTIYPLLTRLKNAGLLSYKWEESSEGPPRKYYQLTENGQIFRMELAKNWDNLVHAVNHITHNESFTNE